MTKKLKVCLLAAVGFGTLQYLFAHTPVSGSEHRSPGIPTLNAQQPRSEFISYDLREQVEQQDRENNKYILELPIHPSEGSSFQTVVDIPYPWLDRQVFLQTNSTPSYYLNINGQAVGYAEDNRTPTQFDITDYIKDGDNTIEWKVVEGTGNRLDSESNQPAKAFIFSQPKIRIEDYTIKFTPDPSGKHGILEIMLCLANGYNTEESLTVGYDIYSPQKKLQHFDLKDMSVKGKQRDTVSFIEPIYNISQNAWSSDNPSLFYGTLNIKRQGRMTEYIPYKTGLGTTTTENGKIIRNGAPVVIKAISYNVKGDDELNISQLKKNGYNTLVPDYPQPIWFYDLCDKLGMYVIDQANIHSPDHNGDISLNGALANNPDWLETYLYRMVSSYERTKNHTCVIGFSLGGKTGNGYNMYRGYLMLKEKEGLRAEVIPDQRSEYERSQIVNSALKGTERAIIFMDASGQWNSDIQYLQVDGR